MTGNELPVIQQMQNLIDRWQETSDQRSIFLTCYCMMTRNMLSVSDVAVFQDPPWVHHLLHRFADYYFSALDAFDRSPDNAPAVWQLAFRGCSQPDLWGVQKLLLGVNAHINYDLVLTLTEVLQPEWAQLDDSRRSLRYTDHCQVNQVIAQTIDSVQDQVLEPDMPALDLVDRFLGRLDEHLIARIITNWRETVWQNAVRVLESPDAAEKARILAEVERDALRIAARIRTPGLVGMLDEIW